MKINSESFIFKFLLIKYFLTFKSFIFYSAVKKLVIIITKYFSLFLKIIASNYHYFIIKKHLFFYRVKQKFPLQFLFFDLDFCFQKSNNIITIIIFLKSNGTIINYHFSKNKTKYVKQIKNSK